MALESVTYISDLVATNPIGATDPKSQGDDHIRNIKAGVLATFPNVSGAMTASHTELNHLDGVTTPTGSGALVLASSPTIDDLTVTTGITLPSASIADAALSSNVPLLDAANTFSANQTISNAQPQLQLSETDEGADWRAVVGSGIFRIQRIDGGVANAIALSGDGAGNISEVELNAALLDFNGAADFSQQATFNGVGSLVSNTSAVRIVSTEPYQEFYESDQGSDAKRWLVGSSSSLFFIATAPDSGASGAQNALRFARSGVSVSEVELNATTLDLNGALDLDGGAHNLNGTSSVTLVSGSAALTVAGSEVDLTASALDFNGNADVSGTLTVHGTLTMADASAIVYDGETVEIGANDSGGAGYRILRIPNA